MSTSSGPPIVCADVPMLTDNAARVLENRYLDRTEAGLSETPLELFERVAKHIASAEDEECRNEWRNKFLDVMTAGKFMPNSPTLMNSGRKLGLLSACQPYHAPVLTDNGYKAIGDIVKSASRGEKVIVSDGQGAWVPVLAAVSRGIQDVYRVYLSHSRYLDATANHLIFSARSHNEKTSPFEWRELQQLEIGDYLQFGQQAYNSSGIQFSSEIALSAWLLTDGGAGTRQQSSGTGEFFVREVQLVDVKSLVHVRNLFDSLGFRYSLRREPEVNVEQFVSVRSNDRNLLDLCNKFEIVDCCEKKHVCLAIKCADIESRREFLRVVFEADGYINGQNFIGFQSSSEIFVRDVREMLDCFGISGSISHKNDPRENRVGGWFLAISHNTDVRLFRDRIGFISDRKQKRLADVPKKKFISRKLYVDYIQLLSTEEVFDIQTAADGNGSYVTNGVVVHNCFVLPIPDSIVGIFKAINNTALVQRAGGGVGFAFDEMRPCGSFVSSSGGKSSGPISFWRVFCEATNAIQQGCVVGSTLIATASGSRPISDLVGERPWVFTYSSDKGRIAVERASAVFKTKLNAEVWKLTTDKGLTLCATPDHLVLCRDGVDRPLSKLKPGMSLMPFSRCKVGKDIRVTLQDGVDTWVAQHRLVYADTRNVSFDAIVGLDVHRIDRDHFNDTFANLQLMTRAEHARERGTNDLNINLRVTKYPKFVAKNGTHKTGSFYLSSSDKELTDYRKRISAGLSKNNPVKEPIVFSKRSLRSNPEIKRFAKMGKAIVAVASVMRKGMNVSSPEAWRFSRKCLAVCQQYEPETLLELFGDWDSVLGHVMRYERTYTSKRAELLDAMAALVNAGFNPRDDSEWDNALKRFPEFPGKSCGSKFVRSEFGSVVGLWEYLSTVNQKVASVEFSHNEDVYDMTVPSSNHFAVVQEATVDSSGLILHNSFRRGANMAVMDVNHPDIIKFLFAKQNLSQFTNYNVSVKVSTLFMAAVRDSEDSRFVVCWGNKSWLVPRSIIERCRKAVADGISSINDVRELDACYALNDLIPEDSPIAAEIDCVTVKDIFDIIVGNAWKTGEPGLCFIDKIHELEALPDISPIRATNPCGEEPLVPHGSCNLGSINLRQFVIPFYRSNSSSVSNNGDLSDISREALVDWDGLRDTVRTAVRFLDNVVTINKFPTQEIREVADSERRIGLGVMGFADALIRLNVSYDSQDGLAWGERLMGFVNREAIFASQELAKSRGEFPLYSKSRWADGFLFKHFDVASAPMRNVCVTTVAPTGTISIISNCSGGIEPLFSFAFKRQVLNGEVMMEVHDDFMEVAKLWGFDKSEVYEQAFDKGSIISGPAVPAKAKRIFKSARDITPEYHVRMQAAFQKHVTSAISKTINLANDATEDDVRSAYLLADSLGCKGVTVYRDGCRSMQPMALKSSSKTHEAEITVTPEKDVFQSPVELPTMMNSVRTRYRATYGNLHIHVSLDVTKDGRYRERELFFDLGRGGDGISNITEGYARLASMVLRLGGSLDLIIDQLRGHGSCGEARNRENGMATSIPSELAMGVLSYYKSVLPFRDKDGFLTQLPGPTELAAPAPKRSKLPSSVDERSNAFVQHVAKAAGKIGTLSTPCPTPSCDGYLVYMEGCKKCLSCGVSQC